MALHISVISQEVGVLRLLATVLTLVGIAVTLLVGQTQAASAKQEKCRSTKQGIVFYQKATWKWEERLAINRTKPVLTRSQLAVHKGCKYLQRLAKGWQRHAAKLRGKYSTLRAPTSRLTTSQLYDNAQWEIAHGAIYGHGWGAVSSRLQELCYELVSRAFSPYGTSDWAVYIVRRESGCNPAAINYTYNDPGERATGLSQMIPNVHTWVDYQRVMYDLKYAIAVFVRLSDGGRSTGPWCLC